MYHAADIELAVTRHLDGTTVAALRIELPHQRIDSVLGVPLTLDDHVLRALSLSPDVYGATLTAMVFTPALGEGWRAARGFAEGQAKALRVRLTLEGDEALHAIRWELLRDPIDHTPLAYSERIRLSRFLPTNSFHPLQLPARPELRAVVAVANPPGLPAGMSPVDVAGEVARAQQGLGLISAVVLDGSGGRPRATLPNIAAALRSDAQILYLVCHGALIEDQPYLWLEQEGEGRYQPALGEDLVQLVARLEQRPRLIILAACRSGGDWDRTLVAVGPRLARQGVGAVVAMQGDVPMDLVTALMPRLFTELQRDGQIDRALAAARSALPADQPWWMPVLWMAVRDGALWHDDAAEDRAPARLRALMHDQSGFVTGRLERFVGRSAELAELRRLAAELRPQGGYVTIRAQAGQGKSSVIARMVADEVGATGDFASVVCHFIPLDPGPDHQVTLLRNLLARLCLRYSLSEHYVSGETRASLRDAFARALQELARRGEAVTVYVDGLDQLEPEPDGSRDLSFLPEIPPAGVVFVLGVRPDDTLQSLMPRQPQRPYLLPPLSRVDFSELLLQRGARLSAPLADRLYVSLQANVLYLDLAARELALSPSTPPARLLARIADDPQHLFTLSMNRLRRQRDQWRLVVKPLLGVLLVARRSLSRAALRRLVQVDDEELREALERLGGLVLRDQRGNYTLYHLKLRDYLREEPARPEKPFVFAADEERELHGRLAAWCAPEENALWEETADPLEQECRALARRHSVYHLARAGAYERLWALLDRGPYVSAKLRFDPSTRLLALDLDNARQAVIDASAGGEQRSLALLPQLWRYSLMRVGLAGRADRYPRALFLALVALGRAREAESLADLLTDVVARADTLCAIGGALSAAGVAERGRALLLRAYELAGDLPEHQRQHVQVAVIDQCLQTGDLVTAQTLIAELPEGRTARLDTRGYALVRYAVAATKAGGITSGAAALDALSETQRDEGRVEAVQALASLGLLEQAHALAVPIREALPRLRADVALANAGAQRAAKQGDVAGVLESVAALAIPRERERVIQQAAWRAAWSGHWDAAAAMLGELTDGFARARVLAALAATADDMSRADDAFAVACELPPDERDRALFGLARDMATAGRAAEADRALLAIHSVYQRARATAEAAQHLIATGAIAEACAQARALHALQPDSWQADLAAILDSLVRAGSSSAAESLLRELLPEEERPWGSGMLALAHAQVGQVAEASVWLDQSRREAAGLSRRQVALDMSCRTVAHALAAVGQLDAALRAADGIADLRERVTAQVGAVLLAGAPERAMTLTEGVVDSDTRTLLLGELARELCRRGRLSQAEAVIAAMPPGYQREQADAELAAALATSGQFDQANVMASGFEDLRFRARAYGTLAVALHSAGQHAEALQALDACRTAVASIPEEFVGLRDEANAALGVVTAALGQIDEAMQRFGLLSASSPYQSELALVLIRGLVGVGRVAEGERLAREQPAGYPHDAALTALCGALAATGGLAAAQAIIGELGTEEARFQRQRAIVEGLLSAGRIDAAVDLVRWPPLSGDVALLCQVALDLVKLGREAEARELFDLAVWVTQSPHAAAQRSALASVLTATLAEAGYRRWIVQLTQGWWRSAQTSDELLTLLPAAAPLLVISPELGPALLAAYDEAERQLSEMA